MREIYQVQLDSLGIKKSPTIKLHLVPTEVHWTMFSLANLNKERAENGLKLRKVTDTTCSTILRQKKKTRKRIVWHTGLDFKKAGCVRKYESLKITTEVTIQSKDSKGLTCQGTSSQTTFRSTHESAGRENSRCGRQSEIPLGLRHLASVEIHHISFGDQRLVLSLSQVETADPKHPFYPGTN